MLHTTRGIVIHTNKFSETSIIARIYTELFGLQSYMVKGIRNPRARMKSSLFQPLSILEISAYHKEKASLQNLKDAHHAYLYQTLPFDIRKSSIGLFIDELVYKTIREEDPNRELFSFLQESCITLDSMEEGFSHFHILFAIRLTAWLGITPHDTWSLSNRYFDLREGEFVSELPSHPDRLDGDESRMMHMLLSVPSGQWPVMPFTAHARDLILEKIILYYRLHIPGFQGLKSHTVLRSVLS